AMLHGLWLPPEIARDVAHRPEFVRDARIAKPRDHAHSRRGELRFRRRSLCDGDIVQLGGLPVTSLIRTWRDLAERLALVDLVAAGDSTLRLGATLTGMTRAIAASAGQRAVRKA